MLVILIEEEEVQTWASKKETRYSSRKSSMKITIPRCEVFTAFIWTKKFVQCIADTSPKKPIHSL